MRLFVFTAFCALALGGYFWDDISLYVTDEFGGTQGTGSGGGSFGNLGNSVNNSMRNIGDTLGR